MSKKFKSQDYFRYRRLGKKWRKPKGRHSKLREKRSGSGIWATVGRKRKARQKPLVVNSAKDLKNLEKDSVILISSNVGAKKAIAIATEAERLEIKIQNKKRIKRIEFLLKKKEEAKKKGSAEKKKEEEKKAEEKKEREKEKSKEEAKKEKQIFKDEKKKSSETAEEKKKEGVASTTVVGE